MRKSFIWGFILYFSKVYYFSISEKDGIVATRPTYLRRSSIFDVFKQINFGELIQ